MLCSNCHREYHFLNSYYNITLEQFLKNEYDISSLDKIEKNQEQKQFCLKGINNSNKNKKQNYCIDCGKPITNNSKRCIECSNKNKRYFERPNRNELKYLIRNFSMVKVGEKYGVTDNTIRKWCKAENLPYKKKEINNYSDKEWEFI